jgi:DNA invertase Pin-like site-specific DNA recombinase
LALIGYARVSSIGQSLDIQLNKLQHCQKIFQEKASGASGQRPRLHACLEYVREGDTLVVTRLDRLARSTLQLCRIADELQRKQVHLQVLDQHIDTSDATGRLLFHMLGAIAQFETEIRAERQMDGIQKAKERGIQFGRKKTLTTTQIAALWHRRTQGVRIKTLMQDYGLSKASVYRYLHDTHASLSGGSVESATAL